MNLNWLIPNLIYVCKHGSYAYGMNTSLSDLDIKGVCKSPKEVESNLFQHFEQAINNIDISNKFSQNFPGKIESTIYSLKKFIILCANVNPNCIELLWVDPQDILFINKVGEKLLENRDLFISARAKFTLSGYSFSQFAKIERHRKWLIKGELSKPDRKDFGLSGEILKGHAEIDRIVKKDIENWNLSKFPLDELERQDLKETIWDCVLNLCQVKVDWGNWPVKYEQAALNKFLSEFNVSEQITDLIIRETKYKNALKEYQNWVRWKEQRNLDRFKLEEKYKFDTKHGAHLMRLMRMGCEILEGKGVLTKRPDAEELLFIRNGGWTYEKLMEEFNKLNLKLEELYKVTKLPRSVNYEKINELYYQLLEL